MICPHIWICWKTVSKIKLYIMNKTSAKTNMCVTCTYYTKTPISLCTCPSFSPFYIYCSYPTFTALCSISTSQKLAEDTLHNFTFTPLSLCSMTCDMELHINTQIQTDAQIKWPHTLTTFWYSNQPYLKICAEKIDMYKSRV